MDLELDRIQLVVTDREAVAERFHRLLGAEEVRADTLATASARRTVLALGTSEVELLEPNAPGAARTFLDHSGGGLFAAGVAAADPGALAAHLEARGTPILREREQVFLSPEATGLPGLRLVISPAVRREPVGLLRFLYEATLLAPDFQKTSHHLADLLNLDAEHFAPIRSEQFGYEGLLTLFDPERLDRIEAITPFDAEKTMGRFFARRGPTLYMCYGESDDTAAIRERAREHAPADWTGPQSDAVPDNLFLHPKALGGLMLGVSRTTVAWTWSGHPERVRPAAS